jgi:DNA repair protein RecN (Recombination protein N)
VLRELRVVDLGVIEELTLLLDRGTTAVTGETGAGKTLVVEAIELLVGGRADPTIVRAGAAEALVEGRFELADDEIVLRRLVPRDGRSRAYVDGRLATVGELAEWGRRLVDLYGQHAHQSLLSGTVQRAALDRFAGIDLAPLRAAEKELERIAERQAALGGDRRERAREIDLLRFQVTELDQAGLDDPDEDAVLDAEEDRLADAVAHREAAAATVEALAADGGAVDAIGAAVGALDARPPFADLVVRLRDVAAEVADVASEARSRGEQLTDDPERLAEIRRRRQRLRDLRRKYGDSLTEVMAYRDEVAVRLAELESHDALAAALEGEREAALVDLALEARRVGEARRAAAPDLAAAVQANLRDLALAKARLEVDVGEVDPGDEVTIGFAANPGSALAPLRKVASGGELARAMLALRLVLTEAPSTLVFDEVDAGVGGAAAVAVGRSLAALGAEHQVLVVTHLPQVAAFADHHAVVTKVVGRHRTSTAVALVDGDDRVVELARMLSGSPDSATAREHARELLAETVVGPSGAPPLRR